MRQVDYYSFSKYYSEPCSISGPDHVYCPRATVHMHFSIIIHTKPEAQQSDSCKDKSNRCAQMVVHVY